MKIFKLLQYETSDFIATDLYPKLNQRLQDLTRHAAACITRLVTIVWESLNSD